MAYASITIRLPSESKKYLDKIACESDRSLSSQVRVILKEWISAKLKEGR